MNHRAAHPITPLVATYTTTCGECGAPVAYVEPATQLRAGSYVSLAGHWRHKPSGYHHGDAVRRRLAAEIITAIEGLRAFEHDGDFVRDARPEYPELHYVNRLGVIGRIRELSR